jgi:hypothetical protein
MDNEKIRKEAKEMLDKFASALDDIDIDIKSEKREEGGFREEGSGESSDSDFRDSMFANAPEKDGDCIVAEKKKW